MRAFLTSMSAVLLVFLTNCTGAAPVVQEGSVWNTYDVRAAVPSRVALPGEAVGGQENDYMYTQPKKYHCVDLLESDFPCE